jgi:pimeloyl-ACP methyl ester carboxylesterase
MKSKGLLGGVVFLLAMVSGCATTSSETQGAVSSRVAPPPQATSIVFCADGAGGFSATTETLRETARAARLPIRVEMIDWSHGRWRVWMDHLHHANIVEKGRILAVQLRQWRAQQPGLPIHLVGHSAGCAVVLAAAEEMPAGSLERIVLLAPSVSSCYDLRPALASTRQGIDVFSSRSDWFVLGFGMRISGTTDRRWTSAAGRVGFEPVGTTPADAALYTRLHQHFWEPSQAWTGNRGGHYGSFEEKFLRAYVLPLLTEPRLPRSCPG